MSVRDTLGRPLRNLRVSVTDRCNLRCSYCMPEEDYVWLSKEHILSFEEITRLVGYFVEAGVNRVRFTGGEPLLRRDLPELVRMVAGDTRIQDLALTTNGVRLAESAQALKAAGLHRLTVSLDTLQHQRFQDLTRRDELGRVLEGIQATAAAGFQNSKLDTVVMRGVNEDEIGSMLEFARSAGFEPRFIEYMDVGGATRWSWDQVVSRQEILERISRDFGPCEPLPKSDTAPANRYRLADGTVFGTISSTTAPFCNSCDRSRLTADGVWYRCLYATSGTDLRQPLRSESGPETIRGLISSTWEQRGDRGAEERLEMHARGRLHDAADLRRDPHLEMHTRGG